MDNSHEAAGHSGLNATRTVQRRYRRIAGVYDRQEALMERLLFARLRRSLWSKVRGRPTLEVGVGTGKNVAYYPADARMVAVDLVPEMATRAARRIAKSGVSADVALMDAQALAFKDGSFDTVVATFVFCSVPDPVAGLRELRRVLRPGGHLLLLEHVRAEQPLVGAIMDRLNPIASRMTGANINRRTVDNVGAAGFQVTGVEKHAGIIRLIEATP
jgi:phosphatidylethanolamine/phosphatidyl-N-methylethanolamine N-methyltransferase